ncbi:hypothetical protein Bpfe_012880 [Biomphalaria pfeifferi]|uniref:Uncharacterized protein n=1 Tax=Biomphalaria pfeifferi TaxID=112525 RepID=A0AAD8FAX0_BIOPF|nr:hypothetical protein Bpfe_012880 [Biomphalaria pfeifferi]
MDSGAIRKKSIIKMTSPSSEAIALDWNPRSSLSPQFRFPKDIPKRLTHLPNDLTSEHEPRNSQFVNGFSPLSYIIFFGAVSFTGVPPGEEMTRSGACRGHEGCGMGGDRISERKDCEHLTP